MKKKTYTFADHLGLLILTFFTLSAVFPAITTFGKNIFFCLAGELLWLILTIYSDRTDFPPLFNRYSWWIVLLLYLFFVPRMFENITVSNRYTPYFIGVFGVMMFEYYHQAQKMDIIGKAIKIASPFYFFTLVKTIQAASENPVLVRTIKADVESFALLRQGIGNYGFVYSSVLIFSAATIIFLFSQKLRARIAALIVMVLCLTLFSATHYFTSLIIAVLVFIITLMLYIKHCVKSREKIKILDLFALVIVFFIVFLGRESIYSSLSALLGDETTRIGSVINSGGTSTLQSIADEFVEDRFPTMMDSIKIFTDYPFLGNAVLTRGITSNLGQHSSILDTFALHGFIIGIAFIKMLGLPYKKYTFCRNNVEYRRPLYLALFFIALFNNLTFSILFVSTVICPYFIYGLEKEKLNKEEE